MQAPTTLTGSSGFNRLTAGAIGLALLAAMTVGAIALNNKVDLPFTGSSSQAQPTVVDQVAQIQLIEQNSFDYAASKPVDPLFLEENSWDYQPVANYATVESIQLFEQNSFDYVTPTSIQEIHVTETNSWDWDVQAQPAGDAPAETSAPNYLFMEENSWDTDHPVLPADSGQVDF